MFNIPRVVKGEPYDPQFRKIEMEAIVAILTEELPGWQVQAVDGVTERGNGVREINPGYRYIMLAAPDGTEVDLSVQYGKFRMHFDSFDRVEIPMDDPRAFDLLVIEVKRGLAVLKEKRQVGN